MESGLPRAHCCPRSLWPTGLFHPHCPLEGHHLLFWVLGGPRIRPPHSAPLASARCRMHQQRRNHLTNWRVGAQSALHRVLCVNVRASSPWLEAVPVLLIFHHFLSFWHHHLIFDSGHFNLQTLFLVIAYDLERGRGRQCLLIFSYWTCYISVKASPN